jgi:hypothetical protein
MRSVPNRRNPPTKATGNNARFALNFVGKGHVLGLAHQINTNPTCAGCVVSRVNIASTGEVSRTAASDLGM